MITISLCMIVKNEEAVLARCLDSVADLVDEIVIVDTGSTDKTKEIAAKYTNHIYDFEWVDDFSKARNFAFSKASCEYIYSADADEVLDLENRVRFSMLKETLLPEIDIVQMKYGNQMQFETVYNYDEEYRPKLFKRVRTFEWIEPIHETIRLEPIVFDSDIVITHLPVESHGARDLANFAKQIREGRRLSQRLLNMYARELLMAGSPKDLAFASEYMEQVVKEEGRSEQEILEALCVLIWNAAKQKDSKGMLRFVTKALGLSECAEVYSALGHYYLSEEDYEEAILWFYNGAYEAEPVLVKKMGDEVPLKGLVECYEKLGMEEQAKWYRSEMETLGE